MSNKQPPAITDYLKILNIALHFELLLHFGLEREIIWLTKTKKSFFMMR